MLKTAGKINFKEETLGNVFYEGNSKTKEIGTMAEIINTVVLEPADCELECKGEKISVRVRNIEIGVHGLSGKEIKENPELIKTAKEKVLKAILMMGENKRFSELNAFLNDRRQPFVFFRPQRMFWVSKNVKLIRK